MKSVFVIELWAPRPLGPSEKRLEDISKLSLQSTGSWALIHDGRWLPQGVTPLQFQAAFRNEADMMLHCPRPAIPCLPLQSGNCPLCPPPMSLAVVSSCFPWF